jgi:hypothetical protein
LSDSEKRRFAQDIGCLVEGQVDIKFKPPGMITDGNSVCLFYEGHLRNYLDK